MDPLVHVEDEGTLLRWGGLSGLLGGVLMLFVFVFVGAAVGPDPAGPEGPVIRFPEIMAARTLENALYLVVMALWVTHVAALSRALARVSPAPALVGGVLGIAGLTVLAAGALPHVATSRLADLYHASGATPQDRATVVLLWQANQGIFDALLAVGLLLLPIGLVALGVGMLSAQAFGRGYGGATIILGSIGCVAATAFVLDPHSSIVAVGLLAVTAFHLILGWKVHRLSSAPGGVPAAYPAAQGASS